MTNKNMTDEKIPFNVRELKKMYKREFYLTVIGHNTAGKIFSKAFKDIEGTIGEIIYRESCVCDFYKLGYIKKITCEDGTELGDSIYTIPVKKYIFKMDDKPNGLDLSDESSPVLRGVAKEYKFYLNELGKNYNVTIYLGEILEFKEKSGIRCP